MKSILIIFILAVIAIPFFQGCSVEQNTTVEVRYDTLVITENSKEIHLTNGTLLHNGEPFSGRIITLFDNSDTLSIATYLLGREDGIQESWYENGQKKESRYYDNGKKAGIHTGWYENGSQRFVYNFKDGEYEGELKEWYPNGHIYKDFKYVKGHEAGMQTAWKPNGKLLVNYEVKNGRKYGLIGTHSCKSLWDDEPKGDNNESSM